jgi:antitoxin HigA-1
MEPLGISINQLSRDLSVPPNRVSEIVNGKKSITADTALRLQRYFGVEAQFWLNLQTEYDLRIIKRKIWPDLERRIIPVKTTETEMVENARYIANAVDLPVIADADTGYGNSINVWRTVREHESAGVAAIHIEDQVFPKKCGFFEGKQVIPSGENVQKIKAAFDARRDKD